jgi:hypothetical protein
MTSILRSVSPPGCTAGVGSVPFLEAAQRSGAAVGLHCCSALPASLLVDLRLEVRPRADAVLAGPFGDPRAAAAQILVTATCGLGLATEREAADSFALARGSASWIGSQAAARGPALLASRRQA